MTCYMRNAGRILQLIALPLKLEKMIRFSQLHPEDAIYYLF
jgi:hypothetical protein